MAAPADGRARAWPHQIATIKLACGSFCARLVDPEKHQG
jgi:hypothetical protein